MNSLIKDILTRIEPDRFIFTNTVYSTLSSTYVSTFFPSFLTLAITAVDCYEADLIELSSIQPES